MNKMWCSIFMIEQAFDIVELKSILRGVINGDNWI